MSGRPTPKNILMFSFMILERIHLNAKAKYGMDSTSYVTGVSQSVHHLCSKVPTSNATDPSVPFCERFYAEANISRTVFLSPLTKDTSHINEGDITMSMQMTPSMFGVFQMMTEHWSGPISVALYLQCNQATTSLFAQIQNWTQSGRIHIHIVLRNGVSRTRK